MKYIFVTGGVVSGLGKGHLRRISGAAAEASAACGSGTRSLTHTSMWIPAP